LPTVLEPEIETIAQIFAGKILDWSELGLPAGPINIHAPTPESGTFETFETLVLKPRKLELAASAKRTENHAEQSDQVARDPRAIGFTGIAYQRNAKALNIESRCGLIAAPSLFSMKTEEYPLARRLFLYTDGEPRDPLAKGLLQFALAPAAQPIVKANDFVDQSPERIPYVSQGARIANALNAPADAFDLGLMNTLIGDLKGADRLSVTFRFTTASFSLDNKALSDVARLRDLLATPDYRSASVYLVGFADSVGLFSNNLRLSQRRSQAVLSALASSGAASGALTGVTTKAYSALAPVSA
jgi:phosphate transport system substrate-binding protein